MKSASVPMWMALVVLIQYSFVWGANGGERREQTQKRAIAKGYKAPNRPFYALVRMASGEMCGGTIIGQMKVATAAHCIYQESSLPYILVGDFSRGLHGTLKMIVTQFYFHTGFNSRTYQNDVGVLKLARAVSSFSVLPICASKYRNVGPVYVVGMGYLDGNRGTLASVLQEVKLQDVSGSQCRYHNSRTFDYTTQVCVTGDQGRDSCGGDSGGPLFLKDRKGKPKCLYGIVSIGDVRCLGHGSYIRASQYSQWLLNA